MRFILNKKVQKNLNKKIARLVQIRRVIFCQPKEYLRNRFREGFLPVDCSFTLALIEFIFLISLFSHSFPSIDITISVLSYFFALLPWFFQCIVGPNN